MTIEVCKNGLPILDQFSEEGFIDCVFKIADLIDANQFFKLKLQASYEEQDLEIEVEVLKDIKGGFDSEMALIREHVYRNCIKFSRVGSKSDALINILARLYSIDETDLRMVSQETFTGIALHQGDIDIAEERVKIKIFGKDQSENLEEDYYESFFNIDLKAGFVFWNEKDQDYRRQLIKGLSVEKLK